MKIPVCFVAATVMFLNGAAVVAAQEAHAAHEPGDMRHLRGTVSDLDYRNGNLTLRTRARRSVDIEVLPSTNIAERRRGDDQYTGLTDIRVGSEIDVDVSRGSDALEAESITIDRP